ncbi:membrane hypothetical protein [Candidatus Sulfopaludibacter sp. SbA3]|nr:membrane hypothetical protein [Candidatus Sulfopaludibacter sp. SbA3]
MLGFVSLVGAASTILFGLVPALRASAASPGDALKRGGGKLTPRKAMLRPLVAAQVSFSFMVLFVGGLLLLSFRTLITMDLGFTRTDVILADVEAKKRTGDAVQASRQWLDAVLRIPGVRAAGLSGFALLDGNIWWTDIQPPGSAQKTQYRLLDVSPEFFDTMKMRLVDGRSFDVRDLAPKSPSVVINQAFARLCCPGENPVGKHFWRNRDNYSVEKEVIGVVRDAKYDQLRPPGPPTVYLPLSDFGGALEVRTSVDPKLVLAGMERALDAIDPSVRVSRLRLQSTVIDDMLIPERLLAILATFFAAVALVLASVGLYGVLSYSVVRRRKEIGIRVALGAQRAIVMRLVASEIVLVTLAGLAVGLAGGWVLARLAATMLFSVKPSDTASLALPLGALLLAAALAALPPALRAAQVDPMAALREE